MLLIDFLLIAGELFLRFCNEKILILYSKELKTFEIDFLNKYLFKYTMPLESFLFIYYKEGQNKYAG